ncbi:hypothetical protein D5S17_35535 [Pseudonocardiaceae bacterium YIM PH 21723]|nr:hypothetical protein D5S17_35535 [Pseudonocardiaceae bacterium YIM PH 21723]
MDTEDTPPTPLDEFVWLIEKSDDGDTWWTGDHPVHGDLFAGGLALGSSAEEVARMMLERRITVLYEDTDFDWEELWFRCSVWNYQHAIDGTRFSGLPPRPLEESGTTAQAYGRYLRHHDEEPFAVEVRTSRQVRHLARSLHSQRVASSQPTPLWPFSAQLASESRPIHSAPTVP